MPPQTEESRWFSAQVAQHDSALRAYLTKRFPSLPDHDDLVQETYLRTVRAWKSGRLTHVRGFLFTAARNIAIDLVRGRGAGHENLTDEKLMPLLDEVPGVPEVLDERQRQQALIDAVGSLPPQCRRVMICRHVDGLSYQEIALRLGLSPQTVKGHLVKGVRDCIGYFDAHGMLEGVTGERSEA
ncbi:MAG: sigma-70 family RNA polymerase sigma factor [Opitutaceae bacterium]|nr:sigma-70 family RNA polymerase sigma factor [Opitutaceae bacterium]